MHNVSRRSEHRRVTCRGAAVTVRRRVVPVIGFGFDDATTHMVDQQFHTDHACAALRRGGREVDLRDMNHCGMRFCPRREERRRTRSKGVVANGPSRPNGGPLDSDYFEEPGFDDSPQ